MRRVVPTWPVVVAAALSLGACGMREGDPEDVGVSLALADTAACRPIGAVDSVRFEALGHFPVTTAGAIVAFEPGATPAISTFPAATRAFRVEAVGATWRGSGVAYRPADGGSTAVLLLPLRRACPSADPELRAPASAALTGLDDGSLLVVGGHQDAQATRRVLLRRPGERFAEIVLGGLGVRREGATATVVGDRVIVAGGALGDEGPAHDSYEVYDHGARAMVREAAGLLVSPRRDHGAARLPDGRVLLAGGVASSGGASLDSAEILDPETGLASAVGPLPGARRAPAVVTLDEGTVLVLGGYAEASGVCAPSVFVFDPASELFEAAPGIALPPFARARAVPLPGGRVAYLGDARAGLSSAAIQVLRVDPSFGVVADTVDLGGGLPELVAVEAAPLLDGRVLVTGSDSGGDARAFVLDLGLARVEEVSALGAPTELVALADGLVVALDEAGAVFFRHSTTSAYGHLAAIPIDEELAFDAPSRWSTADPVRFTALAEGARFDFAPHRFEAFAVDSFEVESGRAELLMTLASGEVVALAVEPESVGAPSCPTERAPGEPLVLERRGETVTLSAGGAARTCRIEGLVGEVGVAVRAGLGAVVRAPSLRRL